MNHLHKHSKTLLALLCAAAMLLSLTACGQTAASPAQEPTAEAAAAEEAPAEAPVADGTLLLPAEISVAEGYTDYVFAFTDAGTVVSGDVVFTSSDESVVTVDENGAVSALKAGEVTITAVKGGSLSNECKVTVFPINKDKGNAALNATQYGAGFMIGDPRTDAPELAYPGEYDVGVREIYMSRETATVNPLYNADDAVAAKEAGKAYVDETITVSRPVKMQIYYPANLNGEKALAWINGYSGISAASRPSEAWPFPVRALRNAELNRDGAGEAGYPVILVSHGYQGASTIYSNIEVNLASKGYIVVAIDHTGDSKATGVFPGASVAHSSARVADALAVLDLMEAANWQEGNFLYGAADVAHSITIGHSLGGFTALSMIDDPRVRACVASGPAIYGTAEEAIKNNRNVPILMIEGTEDDTAMYGDNRANFNTLLKGTDSYMLVFEGGNHEMIIDTPSYYLTTENSGSFFDSYLDDAWGYWGTPTEEGGYSAETVEAWHAWREYIFNIEPTWDENHVSDINKHFITAFLEKNIRGDETKGEYLNVDYPISTVNSLYGNYYYPWYGEEGYAALASWKGFQPWTNAGLELYHNAAGNAAEKPVYVSSAEKAAALGADLSDGNWSDQVVPVAFGMPAFEAGSGAYPEAAAAEQAKEYIAAYGSYADALNSYIASCKADAALAEFTSVSGAAEYDIEQIAEGLFGKYSFDYFRDASQKAFGENYAADGNYWLNATVYGPDYAYGDAQTTAPLLAYRGEYGVGVRTVDAMTVNGVNADGDGETYNRPLKMEVWYPAEDSGIEDAQCSYYDWTGQNPSSDDRPNVSYEKTGRALRNAEQVVAGNFPVIVLSHGVDGSRMLLSYLGENLASKGYVVASIEHTDSTKLYNSNAMSMANRENDDLFAIDLLQMLSENKDSFLYGVADASSAAVIGYSMGGYGATQVAGSGDPRVKAMVGLAPYVTSLEEAADIKVPVLYITGTADQTVEHETVREEFLAAADVDRYMLVYQNGDHEVGSSVTPWIGNNGTYTNAAASEGLTGQDLEAWQVWREYMFYYEPVWEQGTLNNINEHFITAFLDVYLKNNAGGGQDYLDAAAATPVYNANSQSYPWLGFTPYGQSALEFYALPAGITGVTDLAAGAPESDSVELTFTLPEGTAAVRLLKSIDGGYSWKEAAADGLGVESTCVKVTGLRNAAEKVPYDYVTGWSAGKSAEVGTYEEYFDGGIFYYFRLETTDGNGTVALSNMIRVYCCD